MRKQTNLELAKKLDEEEMIKPAAPKKFNLANYCSVGQKQSTKPPVPPIRQETR